MATLLHIAASPRGAASESLQIAGTFLGAYRDTHAGVEIDTLDLWDGTLPEFGPAAAGAKMAVFAGQTRRASSAALAGRDGHVRRFAAADAYLFSVPMWNAGIPYILKQFIDVVSQPGMVFGFDPEPATPGCSPARRQPSSTPAPSTDRPCALPSVTTSSAVPRRLAALDGIDDITGVEFRPNLATADADSHRQRAHAEARDAGKTFRHRAAVHARRAVARRSGRCTGCGVVAPAGRGAAAA